MKEHGASELLFPPPIDTAFDGTPWHPKRQNSSSKDAGNRAFRSVDESVFWQRFPKRLLLRPLFSSSASPAEQYFRRFSTRVLSMKLLHLTGCWPSRLGISFSQTNQ